MTSRRKPAVAAAIALSLGLTVSACADGPQNRSLNSVNQPVVERRSFAIELAGGMDTMPIQEQQRLAGWFEGLDLRYGDRISVEGGGVSHREAVATIAGRYGLLLSEGAPVTAGLLQPGAVRIVVSRSHAFVPNCPDWSDKQATNLTNSTSDNFGCAINSNIAAMVADPEHLLRGAAGTGETTVMSSTKAIDAYREKAPTASAGLPAVSSQSAGS